MKFLKSLGCVAIIAFLSGMSSCSDEKDNLTEAIEDAWSVVEDDIEESAEETLQNYADNPELLYNKDCQTSYISLGNIFTLTIPINYTGRAAIGLLFGSDAERLMSLLDDAGRNSRSKSSVKELIMKHFNSDWASLMTALIILDGEFDYEFETDSLMDSSYEFPAKDLYNILNKKGYFQGSYGDEIPADNRTSYSKSPNGSEINGHTRLKVIMNS